MSRNGDDSKFGVVAHTDNRVVRYCIDGYGHICAPLVSVGNLAS